jgi:L-seryl-tRNA(Ser) seleniumtransferase
MPTSLSSSQQQALRNLPSVNALLQSDPLSELSAAHGHDLVLEATRAELYAQRQAIVQAEQPAPSLAELLTAIGQRLDTLLKPTLHPVINATGVIVHTNLGRALLSQRARTAMQEAAASNNNLEYDIAEGRRGSRYHHAEALLCRLTGAEAAVVVNNNAAALVLCLTAFAQGKEVVISRSQLVEIGGGFRIPDIMAQSGAQLVEVGATNRTYPRDYTAALHPERTGLILRVHHSNFKLIGFTSEPSLAELVSLGEAHGVPVMDDLGSGTLLDTAPYGLDHEPTLGESVSAGASLITASGDKLLGGPQAGLILGRRDLIQRLKKHPLIRAMRVDKITLAALQATLLAYVENRAEQEIPVWQMIATPLSALERRASAWQAALAERGLSSEVRPSQSTVGGGSLPGQVLPTQVLALHVDNPAAVAAALRQTPPHLICRVEDDTILLDPRTVLPEQDSAVVRAVRAGLG